MSLEESELREGKLYYRCTNEKCKRIWEGKSQRCLNCLGNLEQIRLKENKIEVINK